MPNFWRKIWCKHFIWTHFFLDTSAVPPLIYAVMGTSREIAIGPVAVMSLLLSSMIQKLEDPVANSIAYRNLVLTATFFTGAFQAAFGLFRWVILFYFIISYYSFKPIKQVLINPFLLFAFTVWCNRLGFLVDILSHAAVVGFMAGAAIVIGLQQLKGLLGITYFTDKTDVISVMKAVWRSVHHAVTLFLSCFSFFIKFVIMWPKLI